MERYRIKRFKTFLKLVFWRNGGCNDHGVILQNTGGSIYWYDSGLWVRDDDKNL